MCPENIMIIKEKPHKKHFLGYRRGEHRQGVGEAGNDDTGALE